MTVGYAALFGIAVGLAMDATAVATAASLSVSPFSWRTGWRLAFHFGLFQAVMPLAGWWLGGGVQRFIAPVDHWAAFALLSVVGGKMLHEAFGEEEPLRTDPSRGISLVLLSVAVSIDALAVGVSLGILGTAIVLPSLVIGAVTAGMSFSGYALGSALGRLGERWIRAAGGAILILIGLRILAAHLF